MAGTSKKSQQPYSGYLVFYTEPLTGVLVIPSRVILLILLLSLMRSGWHCSYVGAALELSYDKRGFSFVR